ncbi:adenylyltransferase/cytidyltransferase family protein [Streptococcus ovis]|uniref:adenylyltransferase/cytidyltransferase family protein n=1 Tax=Streptococcus ovis TaxID=82806 RepID=UPI0003689E6E|nr:adenylyltransferase/cytidyltransferase family protein [Streptococcus ovis]
MNKILTFGVYDFLHLGHLRLFKQCHLHGDYLIVAVQDSDFILKYKPEAKILYNTSERVEMLEAIKCVDEVLIYQTVSIDFLSIIDFDILALGEDHVAERFCKIEKWCIEHGKKVVRLKRTDGISSSSIKEFLNDSKN